ncbi:MAG: hypothetical protein GF317_13545 [Candidatus Lokiarchaeota archaeon]|nr:hypothetical protein [Candidatus Lokiarchaeota archaeon]MBD3200665.1 hypothetical protein [Candidatus Lokiarchaeota archaeon]
MAENNKLNLRKTIRLIPKLVKKGDPKRIRNFLGNGKYLSDKVRNECNCE